MNHMLNNGHLPMDPVAGLPVIKPERIRAVVEPLVDNFPSCGANDGRQNNRHEKLTDDFQGAAHRGLTPGLAGAVPMMSGM